MTTVLVLGGARSGKSTYAEHLLRDVPDVTYVATGRPSDGTDPEWDARVAHHRSRRPDTWSTVETLDLAAVVAGVPAPSTSAVLIDCLGAWLARVLDEAGWDDEVAAQDAVEVASAKLVEALTGNARHVVLVSNEVGLGIVPEYASGRLFRDLLGRLNVAVGGACDQVALVVAGRVLDLSGSVGVDATPTLGVSHA
jgi:adenosylcobinamide kinase / adenosylcobinamide-phosphate guanylyltransferase